MTVSKIRQIRPIALGLLVIVAGCTSRYRVDLYLIQGENRTRVKIEKTEYAIDAVLGDPMSRDKLVSGKGNCLVLITGSRGQTLEADTEDLVSYDRYLRYRIFLQLPVVVGPATINLKDNSFVQLMGWYERPAEDKLYFPQSGNLIVDSLSGKRLFGTLDGHFENHLGETVMFSGEFKAKIKR